MVPQQFHAALQQSNPTFQQRTREGILMQQDAEECWSSIVSILARKLHAPGPGDAAAGPALGAGGAEGAVMRQLFGIDFVTKLKCEQTGASPVSRWESRRQRQPPRMSLRTRSERL